MKVYKFTFRNSTSSGPLIAVIDLLDTIEHTVFPWIIAGYISPVFRIVTAQNLFPLLQCEPVHFFYSLGASVALQP